jgi:SAM-dependent methyltransferase
MSLAVNYHRWTYEVARRAIGERVLEVGGGLGSFSRFLADRQRLVILDHDPDCTRHLRGRFGRHASVRILDADILDPALPDALRPERLDTAVCMNVLEHIEDDRAALRNIHRALQPGGRLILLVPAHPSLYGTLDELVGHHRRYTRGEVKGKVRAAGFAVQRCLYFNSVGAAGRYVIGRVRRQRETGKGQVRFYDRYVVPLLARAERVIPPPFGQSLVVVGRKT